VITAHGDTGHIRYIGHMLTHRAGNGPGGEQAGRGTGRAGNRPGGEQAGRPGEGKGRPGLGGQPLLAVINLRRGRHEAGGTAGAAGTRPAERRRGGGRSRRHGGRSRHEAGGTTGARPARWGRSRHKADRTTGTRPTRGRRRCSRRRERLRHAGGNAFATQAGAGSGRAGPGRHPGTAPRAAGRSGVALPGKPRTVLDNRQRQRADAGAFGDRITWLWIFRKLLLSQ
jgi:hypothetical protein